MDELVAALGDARVLIRRLELVVSPLESMFFALTGEHDAAALDALEPQRARRHDPGRRMTTVAPDRAGGQLGARRQRRASATRTRPSCTS